MKLKDKLKDNEKIQKLKQYKESFDILWSDPKAHAIIMLSFWFVLVLLLSLVVRLKGDNLESNVYTSDVVFEATSDGVKEYLKNIKSYQATVYVNDQVVSVTDVNNEKLIFYNNSVFYYKDVLYSIDNGEIVVSDDKFISDVSFFNVYNIYNFISDKNQDYITKYSDGSYLISYSVSFKDFMALYDGSIIESDASVDFKFSGVNGIDKIEIDLFDFYDKIVIDINNINNIDSIEYGGVL